MKSKPITPLEIAGGVLSIDMDPTSNVFLHGSFQIDDSGLKWPPEECDDDFDPNEDHNIRKLDLTPRQLGHLRDYLNKVLPKILPHDERVNPELLGSYDEQNYSTYWRENSFIFNIGCSSVEHANITLMTIGDFEVDFENLKLEFKKPLVTIEEDTLFPWFRSKNFTNIQEGYDPPNDVYYQYHTSDDEGKVNHFKFLRTDIPRLIEHHANWTREMVLRYGPARTAED